MEERQGGYYVYIQVGQLINQTLILFRAFKSPLACWQSRMGGVYCIIGSMVQDN